MSIIDGPYLRDCCMKISIRFSTAEADSPAKLIAFIFYQNIKLIEF